MFKNFRSRNNFGFIDGLPNTQQSSVSVRPLQMLTSRRPGAGFTGSKFMDDVGNLQILMASKKGNQIFSLFLREKKIQKPTDVIMLSLSHRSVKGSSRNNLEKK